MCPDPDDGMLDNLWAAATVRLTDGIWACRQPAAPRPVLNGDSDTTGDEPITA